MSRQRMISVRSQKGFTIVEFMIATLVFSMVLIVVTMAIVRLTNMYQRGATTNATQDAARSIIDTVAQAIQFSASDPQLAAADPATAGQTKAWCVGNKQFLYIVHRQLKGDLAADRTDHAFISRAIEAGGCPAATNIAVPSAAGTELLSPNMRLAHFSITPEGSLFTVRVKVVYGDRDLLNNPDDENASCKTDAGSQFCAVSELSTTVQQRL